MEEWQKTHILKNLAELINYTGCNTIFISKLETKNVLSSSESSELQMDTLSSIIRARKLYEILPTRIGAYDILLECLEATNQTGAADILRNNGFDFPTSSRILLNKTNSTLLGTGSSGTKVYKGVFAERDVAVKVVISDFADTAKIENEVNLLKKWDRHPNIIRYFCAQRADSLVYIALELCRMSLEDAVSQKLIRDDSVRVLKECTEGVAFLHNKPIIHGDLKPANILLTEEGVVKIADFGISRELSADSTSATACCGATCWMAPEVLYATKVKAGESTAKRMNTKSDIFSLGCVYFYTLTGGLHPFGDEFDQIYNIKRGNPQDLSGVDKIWQDLIHLMISKQQDARPPAQEILLWDTFENNSINFKKSGISYFNEPRVIGGLKKTDKQSNPGDMDLKYTKIEEEAIIAYRNIIHKHFEENRMGYFEDLELEEMNKKIKSRVTSQIEEQCASLTTKDCNKLEQLFAQVHRMYKEKNRLIRETCNTEDIAIGIDLGTTNCCVGVYYRGRIKFLKNEEGKSITPSYVCINKDGSTEIGILAKKKAFKNLDSTIFDVKRMIGKPFVDENFQENMMLWPFKVKEVEKLPKIQVHGICYYPQEVSGSLLKHLKEMAERSLNKKISKALVTVPAYFGDNQRRATLEAAELAGLKVLRILNEPSAAALAYRQDVFDENTKSKVLVYDLGGGTFDVAVLSVDNTQIDILAVGGDLHLGGEQWPHNAVC